MTYDVGHKRPPMATRFRPGVSGNPAGRPKGRKNNATLITAAMDAKITVTVEGKRRRMSKLEAAFIQQANKAASGDPRALRLMMDLMNGADAYEAAAGGAMRVSAEERRKHHAQILKGLLADEAYGDGEEGEHD